MFLLSEDAYQKYNATSMIVYGLVKPACQNSLLQSSG